MVKLQVQARGLVMRHRDWANRSKIVFDDANRRSLLTVGRVDFCMQVSHSPQIMST
jgi:hypothetical protein